MKFVESLTERSDVHGRYTEPYYGPNNQLDPRLLDVQADAATEEPDEGSGGGAVAREGFVETSQTTTFQDNAGGEMVTAPVIENVVAVVDGTEDIGLGAFLSRPNLIDSTTWSTSDTSGVKTTMLPWYLYLNSTAVKKKIDNFAFIRAKLHIKVLVNGTPFQYGALRTCYAPMLGFSTDKIRTNVTNLLAINVPYSQQPGFFVYPQANAGGEMELPFLYHKNWLDLTSSSDIQNFGTLKHVIFGALRVAVSGGSTAVTVNTYAWLTDVQLMGATTKLAVQGDEYVEGVISGPATAIANAAKSLTKVPVIGKFARATEIGMRAGAGIARLFGFTNVPVIREISGFMPMNGPMLASSHISTAVQKLTLDPKQELSIDPSIHNVVGQDELSINYLKKKESYFGYASWNTSDARTTPLFNARITPCLLMNVNVNNSVPTAVAKRVYHTPLSYMSHMFLHWRGGLVIRLKVICTKFHKGRLKICYDPRGDVSTSDPDSNLVYTHILDIGECDDIEIEIPYHQQTGWLSCDTTISNNWTTASSNTPVDGFNNGMLTVTVLNALTAPATGTVDIMAFVRAADDFEFANPRGFIGPSTSANQTPSLWAVQSEDHVELGTTKVTLGKSAVPNDDRYAMNYGEAFCSLRNLLHRSTTRTTFAQGFTVAANGTQVQRITMRMLPPSPGYFPGTWGTSALKIVAASGNTTFNFSPMHPLTYVTSMFVGYRGSVNFTVTPSTDGYTSIQDCRAIRSTEGIYENGTLSTLYLGAAGDSYSSKMWALNTKYGAMDGLSGMAIDSTMTNGSIAFNVPDYKRYNFGIVDPNANTAYGASDDTDREGVDFIMLFKGGVSSSNNNATIHVAECGGPDFTCLFFLCCPTLDYPNAIPSPI